MSREFLSSRTALPASVSRRSNRRGQPTREQHNKKRPPGPGRIGVNVIIYSTVYWEAGRGNPRSRIERFHLDTLMVASAVPHLKVLVRGRSDRQFPYEKVRLPWTIFLQILCLGSLFGVSGGRQPLEGPLKTCHRSTAAHQIGVGGRRLVQSS